MRDTCVAKVASVTRQINIEDDELHISTQKVGGHRERGMHTKMSKTRFQNSDSLPASQGISLNDSAQEKSIIIEFTRNWPPGAHLLVVGMLRFMS